MKRVLVDTTVWVDFFDRKDEQPHVLALKELLENGDDVCLCPVTYQEILQGIRDDTRFQKIKEILSDFTMLRQENELVVTERAIALYRFLRKKGVTIRKSNDCLIAAYSIEFGVPLLHNDKDFTNIAANYPLEVYER